MRSATVSGRRFGHREALRFARVELAVEDDGGVFRKTTDAGVRTLSPPPGSAPGGCGLGLAIVREIARAHDAEASVGVPESGPRHSLSRNVPAAALRRPRVAA